METFVSLSKLELIVACAVLGAAFLLLLILVIVLLAIRNKRDRRTDWRDYYNASRRPKNSDELNIAANNARKPDILNGRWNYPDLYERFGSA